MTTRIDLDTSALGPPSWCELRTGSIALANANRILVCDAAGSGVQLLELAWMIQRVELSPCGQFVLAIGDQGRRGCVWSLPSSTPTFLLGGEDQARGTLRGGFYRQGDRTVLLSAERGTSVIAYDVAAGSSLFRAILSGMIVFRFERVFDLGDDWLGIFGYRAGEQYESFVAVQREALERDELAIQNALLDRNTLHDEAARLALGRAGNGHSVVFRDPEGLEDIDETEPSTPVEGFRGLCVWHTASRELLQKIDYDGPVVSGASIVGDEKLIAVASADRVDVIDRFTTRIVSIAGQVVGLDPFELRVARYSAGTLEIIDLRTERDHSGDA